MRKNIIIILIIVLACLICTLIGFIISYKPVIPYEYIGKPNDGYVIVSDGQKFGYLNINKSKVNLKYNIIDSMKIDNKINLDQFGYVDGYAIYTDNSKMGIIDKKENEVIKADYDLLQIINKNTIIAYKNGGYYLIDGKGKRLNDEIYLSIQSYKNLDDIFIVSKDNKYGLINSKGENILKPIYSNINHSSNSDNTVHVFTTNDETKITNYYYDDNKLHHVKQGDNLTVTDVTKTEIYFTNEIGNTLIYNIKQNNSTLFDEEYLIVDTFENDLALISNNQNKAGFINKTKEIVIPMEYDTQQTTGFNKYGYAIVSKNSKAGVIDKNNEIIIPFNYDFISQVDKNTYIVFNNNKAKLINSKEKQLNKQEYDHIQATENSKYLLTTKTQNNQTYYGIIDINGKEILKPEYSDIKVYDKYLFFKNNKNYTIQKIK